MCTVLLSTCVNAISFNKYIISYRIRSYIISYHIISYRIVSNCTVPYRISYHIIYHIITHHIISYISYHINNEKRLLATSRLPVCLSVRMEQLSSHWQDFCEIWYLSIFQKTVGENSILIKIWQIVGTLREAQIYVFDHISLDSSLKETYNVLIT